MSRATFLRVLFAAAYLLGCSSPGSSDEQPGSGGSDPKSGAGAGGSAAGSSGAGGSSSGAGGSSSGAGGSSSGATNENGGSGGVWAGGAAGTGGQSNADPDCTKPAGADVAVSGYAIPASSGCTSDLPVGSVSITIADEATFKTTFNCPDEGSSGIDFSRQRLRVTVFLSLLPQLRKWAVEDDQTVHVGYDNPPACGGLGPRSIAHLALLPAGPKPVADDLCGGNCNFGAGGYPQ